MARTCSFPSPHVGPTWHSGRVDEEPTPEDAALEAKILELLGQRAATSTICPSEAARALGGEEWRDLMEPARRAARRLVADGEVTITQRGVPVDPSIATGPIRIRIRKNPRAS